MYTFHKFKPGYIFDERYTLEKLIGSGCFADVWVAKDNCTNSSIALKIFANLDDEGINELAQEYTRMQNLNHVNILKADHFARCGNTPYLVMKNCKGGSLGKKIGNMDGAEIMRVVLDIAEGLKYLHEHKIVHQNIKPANVLVDTNGEKPVYILSDFGISRKTKIRLSHSLSINNKNQGKIYIEAYLAPEEFRPKKVERIPDMKGDIFSLGISLYELACGNLPFDDLSTGRELLYSDIEVDFSEIKDLKLRKIIQWCMQPDKGDRPTVEQILEYVKGKLYEETRRTNSVVCYSPSNKSSSSNASNVSREVNHNINNTTFLPRKSNSIIGRGLKSIVNLFREKNCLEKSLCNSAVFAPAKIAKGDDLNVQVYIYEDYETQKVVIDAKMSDSTAVRRSYIPLNFPVNRGDKITIELKMHGLSVEGDNIKNIYWQNKFTKCNFFAYIPINYSKHKVIGDVYISVNGMELGQMSFFSEIATNTDKSISSEVLAKPYKKVLISYSHKDDNTVKAIADAYKALGIVDYFYDRHSLSPGEIYEKKIFRFIDNCDLFILCWSKNAENSEWVRKERERAFYAALDVPPRLRLYPINIFPYASPPSDMIGSFHFEDYDKLICYKSDEQK